MTDKHYINLPWKDGGRTRAGVDCVGLVCLWLQEQMAFAAAAPQSDVKCDLETLLQGGFKEAGLRRGDVVFFRVKRVGNQIRHVAVYLGENRYLHIIAGGQSRIETGLTLMRRIGLTPAGQLGPQEAEKLAAALAQRELGDPTSVVLFFVAILFSVVSGFLLPGNSGLSNRKGAYGDNPLATAQNPDIPLPDILGTVTVAGNSVYQQLPDKSDATAEPQKWNQVIVLAGGPVNLVDYATGLQISGVSWQDASFFGGTHINGIKINPAQTKDAAVTGSVAGDSNVPSITIYDGSYDVMVPVDVRAQYDRDFPLYGFAGCSYLVFRKIDSTKFQSFNLTQRVQGRRLRTFDADGFVRTVTGESLTDADGSKVRFKLAQEDIEAISSLTVNGTPFAEISAATQTGAVYHLNATKGFVEFITAPTAGAVIAVSYSHFVRDFSSNPAMQAVYLLTDSQRGKGFDEQKVDWAAAVDTRDYFDETVTWVNSLGTNTVPRWQTNYVLDERKAIQDHLQALQDASQMRIFLSGGKIVIRAKADADSVFTFDETNILSENGDGTFSQELSDRSTKPNRVRVLYRSENTLNAETEAAADDEADQAERVGRMGNNGVVEQNLTIPAITTQPQAERMAQTLLIESVQAVRLWRFKTNIQGLPLQPLDVVTLDHSSLPGPTLARIEDLSLDEFDRLEITASEYVKNV